MSINSRFPPDGRECRSLFGGHGKGVPRRSAAGFLSVQTQQITPTTWGLRNSVHLSLCLLQVVAVSWALLTPDPFALIRGTPLGWVQSVSDLVQHTIVFTILSATLFSFCLVIYGEFPPIAVFGMLGYCVCVEGLQAFVPGRTCTPHDAIANVAGFVVGLAFARVVSRLRPTLVRA
jgi:VanZ family protein